MSRVVIAFTAVVMLCSARVLPRDAAAGTDAGASRMDESVAVTQAGGAGSVRVKNLKTLVAIYRGRADDKKRMDDHSVTQCKNGCELGRMFYFRNSLGRLNCEITWLVIEEAAPDNNGPTMKNIEADLTGRGIAAGQFDGVIATGVGLSGNWGGFALFEKEAGEKGVQATAGCFGGHDVRGNLTWYPADDADTAYGTAWNFAHEYQHAIDLVTAEKSGHKDFLHAHPYADRSEAFFKGFYNGGEHWDWIACTFREFDDYLGLKGVTNSFIEAGDADGDGMADEDGRLPMDEKRFGSDAAKKDSDGDGLDDLHEFAADRYGGSDPKKVDSDGDGIKDGDDPYPVIPIAPTIPYFAGDMLKTPEELGHLVSGSFVRNHSGADVDVYCGWNEDGFGFRFDAPRKFKVHLKIDGSASNGFWEGGDTYLMRCGDGDVSFDGLGLSGKIPGATAALSEWVQEAAYNPEKQDEVPPGGFRDWTLLAFFPAKLGQGVSKEINYGGKRDEADVVEGLTLTAGRSIGFNFIFEFEDKTRAVLTPHHTMYATRLEKPNDAPERVVLRGPAITNAAMPQVEVFGARRAPFITVMAGNRAVGRGFGNGPITIVGLDSDGKYRLVADAANFVTGETKSNEIQMVVDRSAAAPVMELHGWTLAAECEAEADFELWCGVGVPVTPVAAIGGARADKYGHVTIELPRSLDGWVVTAFEGSRFEKRAFAEMWKTIDRNFKGDAPDKRLPSDAFSYTFDGVLLVETPGIHAFELSSDDGARLYIDGELVVNHWGHHGLSARVGKIDLSGGLHRAHVDYYELDGWAGIKLRYAPPGGEWTAKLPVSGPVMGDGVWFFGAQTDRLGNRSGFSEAVKP